MSEGRRALQIDTFGNILYVHAGQDSPTSDSYVIDICASFGSKEAKKKYGNIRYVQYPAKTFQAQRLKAKIADLFLQFYHFSVLTFILLDSIRDL